MVRVLDLYADVLGSSPTLTTVWICLDSNPPHFVNSQLVIHESFVFGIS